MNIVLGVNYSHDSSAALAINGEIISAIEEERLNGIKHTRVFPTKAIVKCLDMSGLSVSDIDILATPLESPQYKTDEVIKIIKDQIGYDGYVQFYQHHLCHVAASYFSSGYGKSLAYSLDGVGGQFSSMCAVCNYDGIKIVHSGDAYPESLGLFYSAVTDYLGWRHHYDEGIVMGLAAYGNSDVYIDCMRDIINDHGDFGYKINKDYITYHKERDTWVSDKFISVFGDRRTKNDEILQRHMDIAASLQLSIEEIVLKNLLTIRNEFDYESICLSGGLFMNCSLNGKIVDSGIFKNVFVNPASSDNGNAIGAALLSSKRRVKVSNFYLGDSYRDNDIKHFIDNEKTIKESFSVSRPDNIYKTVAKLLADGCIVCWFKGRMEFGARALGNRSILAAPYPYKQKSIMNDFKKRESFRPFAPSVLGEYSSMYFDTGSEYKPLKTNSENLLVFSSESPYMTTAYRIRKEKFDLVPAVIHEDGTSRIQTVNQHNNIDLYNLISEFNSITGIPMVLNTSLNIKGKPIANTLNDAYSVFIETGADCLVMEGYLIEQ
jgi:carbamoyltransferase